MNEKMKKAAYSFLYRLIFVIFLFLSLMVLKKSAPRVFEKLSAVWNKSANLKAAIGHITAFFKEMLPF